MIKNLNRFIVIVTFIVIQSCNKQNDNITHKVSQDEIRISKNLDSIFLLAHEVYLWNDQLPTVDSFYAKKFINASLNEIKSYENLIFNFTKYVKDKNGELLELNPLKVSTPKYSTIVSRKNNSHENIYTINNTFGLSVAFRNNVPYLLYVDYNSPAGKSGLHRGQQILSINGEKIIDEQSFMNQWKKSLEISFIKLDISENTKNREVRLNASSYEINPVLKRSIISHGDKKIGYFALNSFTPIQNSEKYLSPVFNFFKQENINELIVDLRYNQGGFQSTAEYIANTFVPKEANGKIMYSEHYNKTMREGNSKILENYKLVHESNHPVIINGKEISLYDIDYSIKANTTYFNKEIDFPNLKKIHFIVSDMTASASELLINVLKPHIETQILGVSDKLTDNVHTYGKPVGSFGIQIDNFDLYLAMYELKNSKGESNYFKGIKADKIFIDEVSVDFGTIEDPAISSIIQIGLKKTAGLQRITPFKEYSYYFNNDRLLGNLKNIYHLKLKN